MMIKCGIDTIEIDRLATLKVSIRERFKQRVFTKLELEQAQDQVENLSGLFAAKEAVAKALGTGIGFVGWQEIEIRHLPSGEPTIQLYGNAALVAAKKNLDEWAVSISHDRDKAVAMAVATSKASEK